MRSGCFGARQRHRIGAVGGDDHREAGALEIVAADLRDPRLIVHDQDLLHAFGGGVVRVRAAMPFLKRRRHAAVRVAIVPAATPTAPATAIPSS